MHAKLLLIFAALGLAAACGKERGALCGPGCLGPTAMLSVSPGEVIDSAPAASTAPRVTAVKVLNLGTGETAWRAHTLRNSPWLSVQPDSGTAGQSFNVSADPLGLAAGAYLDTVIVAAAQGDVIGVPVTFVLTP